MSFAAGTMVGLREGFRSERASDRRDQELSLSWAEKSQELSSAWEKWGGRKSF